MDQCTSHEENSPGSRDPANDASRISPREVPDFFDGRQCTPMREARKTPRRRRHCGRFLQCRRTFTTTNSPFCAHPSSRARGSELPKGVAGMSSTHKSAAKPAETSSAGSRESRHPLRAGDRRKSQDVCHLPMCMADGAPPEISTRGGRAVFALLSCLSLHSIRQSPTAAAVGQH